MATKLCEARAACGTTCSEGPCSLAAWVRKLSLAQRTRAELGALNDVELKDISLSHCQIDAIAKGTFSR